jgi:uncharacterized protein YaiI (UPF0178 family)
MPRAERRVVFVSRLTDAVDVSMATCSLDNDTGIRRLVVTEDYGYAATEATARNAVWDAHYRNYSNEAEYQRKINDILLEHMDIIKTGMFQVLGIAIPVAARSKA